MGHEYRTKCKDCGHKFTVSKGGGFIFHLLRCDKCGRTKSISFDKLGEIHDRYLKGLPGPYAIVTQKHDEFVKDNYKGEPLSEEEYERLVELKVGNCRCGGKYTFNAKPRCPKCRSLKLEEGHITIMYD